MAPKKKAATKAAAEEPAAKKAKVDEEAAAEAKEEEPKAPEPPKEKEEDDAADKRPALKESVVFNTPETTLNVVPVQGGKVLKSLTDGGMQYLIAGARANTGIKSGRYFFEAKIVEMLHPSEQQGRSRPPAPKNLVRVGFSTAGSSLILGDGDKGVCFDADGGFHASGRRAHGSQKFFRDVVVGVLLNLDASSPNANTVSLFKNGVRASQPMPLPEGLQGQTLYPHVSFRCVSLQVNFGPAPLKALPFKCRTVGAAAAADVAVSKDAAPKDGKYEVVFPVAFPDEGTFDWLDGYLAKHPQFVELSDRKMQEWAVKSGVWKPKGQNWKSSNDKPEYNFGLPDMDNGSARRLALSLAGVVPRNYVVMEVKQNLCEAERKMNLAKFAAPCFKKVAHVVMGEPKAEYKKAVQEKLLAAKKERSLLQWKAKKAEKERKKLMAERAKAAAEARKKALEEAKKKAEEKKAAEKKEGEEEAEKKDEEMKEAEEKKEDVEMKEAEEKKEEEEDEMGDEPPEVELTDEEKARWFKPATVPDLSEGVLSSTFGNFSIPEKGEGFDAVNFEWQGEAKSKDYLKTWICKRKLESRIQNLQPGEAFKKDSAEFTKTLKEWQEKAKAAKKPAKKEGDEETVVDINDVEDVCDVGGGVPLFVDFAFEDWSLLTLRKEFYSLVTSFKVDVNDAERPGIFEPHVGFYYQKYFKKALNPKAYGVDGIPELLGMIKDTVAIDNSKILVTKLDEEPTSDSIFVKLSEKNRRERQRRIDAGDETARLNFDLLKKLQTAPAPAKPAPAKAPVAVAPAKTTAGTMAPKGPKAAGAGPVAPGPQTAAKGAGKGVTTVTAGKAAGKGKTFAPQIRPQQSKGWGKGW